MNALLKKPSLLLYISLLTITSAFTNINASEHVHAIPLFSWNDTNTYLSYTESTEKIKTLASIATLGRQHFHNLSLAYANKSSMKDLEETMRTIQESIQSAYQTATDGTDEKDLLKKIAEKRNPFNKSSTEILLQSHWYNHGNIIEITSVLHNNQLDIWHKNPTDHFDASLLLGQDFTLNTNNKALASVKYALKNNPITGLHLSRKVEKETSITLELLITNAVWLRKQIAVRIHQEEYEAAELSTSIIWYLYGPRKFRINDLHNVKSYADNSEI